MSSSAGRGRHAVPRTPRAPLIVSVLPFLLASLPGLHADYLLGGAPAVLQHKLRISATLSFFKVAFSTFRFKFGATLRRQAERSEAQAT